MQLTALPCCVFLCCLIGGFLWNCFWLSAAWNIHEQVLIAALDLANLQLAEEHLSKLQKRFPGSSRVKRLQGMVEVRC